MARSERHFCFYFRQNFIDEKPTLPLACGFGFVVGYGQQKADTAVPEKLKEVFIKAWQRSDITRMAEEQDGFLLGGKKNEVVALSATNANVTIKTGRQLFAKVPGVFVMIWMAAATSST